MAGGVAVRASTRRNADAWPKGECAKIPRNGAGLFTRAYNWVSDRDAAIPITASRVDADTQDIADALTASIAKDGQTTVTANLPMANFRHTGVGSGVARTDYASLGQEQDGTANWIAGGGTADAITATYSPAITALIDGQVCRVRATAANATTTPTFAPNGLTARTITKIGGSALAVGDIGAAGHELYLVYRLSATRWELINPANAQIVGGKQTICVPAASWISTTTNGFTGPTQLESATNKVNRKVADFPTGVKRLGNFGVKMPKSWNSGTFTYIVTFEATVGSNNVVFGLQALALRSGDTIDTAFGTAVEGTTAVSSTTQVKDSAESTAVTAGGTVGSQCEVIFQLYRLGSGADTNTGTVRVHEVNIFYTTNARDDT